MTTPPLRLFFALPLSPELASQIVAWRSQYPHAGKPVAESNLHMTLSFLGAQPRGQVPVLEAIAASLRPQAFTLCLDRLARWKNGLLYLAPSQLPTELTELEHRLKDSLLAAGFTLESRAFRPHLTLFRHCHSLPAIPPPTFDWPISEFTLFASENTAKGTHYKALGRWPLLPITTT